MIDAEFNAYVEAIRDAIHAASQMRGEGDKLEIKVSGVLLVALAHVAAGYIALVEHDGTPAERGFDCVLKDSLVEARELAEKHFGPRKVRA